MIRTALRPRWLAWLAVSLLAAYVCLVLGRWQLGVAQSDGADAARREVESRPVVPVAQVVAPHQQWDARVMGNRRVSVTGSYEPHGQFLVPARVLDGRTGYWVVAPLRTTDPAGVLAVVRGWVPTATAPAPPAGTRTVVASLAQGESPSSAALPAGQEGSIDLSRLVNEWDGPLYNAFGFVLSERPDALPAGMRRVPPPQPEGGLQLRNAAYAVQWWVFGAFCPVLWWLMVRAAARDERARRDGPGGVPTDVAAGGPDPRGPSADGADEPAADHPEEHPGDHPADHPADHPENHRETAGATARRVTPTEGA